MRAYVFGPLLSLISIGLCLGGCGDDDSSADASTDAPALDSFFVDVVESDSGAIDSGTADSGGVDAGSVDSGTADSGTGDSGGVDVGPAGDAPNAAGPFAVSVQTAMVGDTPVSACIPGGVRAPLIVFAPGFMIESRFYEPTCQRLASHGFVVVRADPPASFAASHNAMRDSLVGVLDWALSESPFVAQIDPARSS